VLYRLFEEESSILRENVLEVKLHQFNQGYLYPKLNCYIDYDARKMLFYSYLPFHVLSITCLT